MVLNTKIFRDEMEAFAEQRRFHEDFVFPDYEGLGVRNLYSLIGEVFGIGKLAPGKFPEEYFAEFDGVQKVVLFILDGLGYNRLLAHMEKFEGFLSKLAERGVLKPLSSTFPATTSTSLTSIFSGLAPSEHHIIGYRMFSKQCGLVFDTLNMRPVYGYGSRFDFADEFAGTVEPWMSELKEQDVEAFVVTKGSIIGSGLSRLVHRDQEVVPYVLQSDMLEQCRRTLEREGRTFLMAYYGGIDTLEHRYGPYSGETTSEIRSVECNIERFVRTLLEETQKDTLIVLTADHGVSPTSKFYYLKDIPEINEKLMLPPVGDSRAAFLFSKPEQTGDFVDVFRKNVEGFELFSSKELIEKGAFGRSSNSQFLQSIVGDFAAISSGQNGLDYPYFEEDRIRPQRGSHGGMTAEEMIVPLLSARISSLL
jgi:predicted AlkP superfamily pyrophosphatase or phosphodiesterase